MSARPRLLDLFCGAGGAAMGYHRAGFEVVGVDVKRQPHYPFDFHQADALKALTSLFAHGLDDVYGPFDMIHASPPCQRYSHGTVAGHAHKHPDLVGPVRELLIASGRPYIIENVPRAPLHDPLVLCGSMFDLTATDDDGTPLRLERHRLFESNAPLTAPRPCHHDRTVRVAGSYGGARRDKDEARNVRKGGYVPSKAVQQRLLGIDWMPEASMYLAIPPSYTQHVGAQLLPQAPVSGVMTRLPWTPPTLTPARRRCLSCGMPSAACLDRSLAMPDRDDGCCDRCEHPDPRPGRRDE